MPWLDRIADRIAELPAQIQALVSAHEYQAALDALAGDSEALEASSAIRQRAAVHWLREAEKACLDGDRRRMNACLTVAARFHHHDYRKAYVETRRRIQDHTLSLTVASHIVFYLIIFVFLYR